MWRFRLLGLVVTALLLGGLFLAFQALSETTAQDPGLNSLGRVGSDLTATALRLR